MKILLAAVNAKYIHTCPAIYSLKAFAQSCVPEMAGRVTIETAEYTINDNYQDVLAGIMAYEADIIGFSTYIWNVDRVRRLVRDIRCIRGDMVRIWAGGPEAGWYPDRMLTEDGADLCLTGEGEVVFSELVRCTAQKEALIGPEDYPEGLAGLSFLRGGKIVRTGTAQPADLDQIPFLYRDLSLFENRIIYYEASRGCPFACAYCLSGRERGTRYRSLRTVREELQFFLDQRVKQVKFVDRTFNADPAFAMEIWTYIRDHDNGITNFHFEIEADRMTDEELELVSSFRPGLIQMEIGVQSANPETLRSVHRFPQLDRIRRVMSVLEPNQNINLHLDLIAGLPYEGLDSFRESFKAVYDMKPNQLQLGFLKLLKGTELYDRREEYGLVCSQDAPYEVLKTKWLSYGELELLHRISDRVEEYVNSQGFRRSLPLVEKLFPDPFSLFEALAEYYRENGYDRNRPSGKKRYEILADFAAKAAGAGKEADAPAGAGAGTDLEGIREMIRFDQALHIHPSRRMQLEETFDFGSGPVRYHFDHSECSPVNGEAKARTVPLS